MLVNGDLLELERSVYVHCVQVFSDLLEGFYWLTILFFLDNSFLSPIHVHSSDATTEKRHIDPESRAANAWNESLNHSQNIHIVSFFLGCTCLEFHSRSFFLTLIFAPKSILKLKPSK